MDTMIEQVIEACAKVCEEIVTHPAGYHGQWEGYGSVKAVRDGNACAVAIRSIDRSQFTRG